MEDFALLRVCSPSKAVGRRYLERCGRRGGGPVALASLRSFRRRGSLPYLPWKRFAYFVEWQIRATDYDFFGIPNCAWDWEREEKARVWWSDVDELQRFLPPLPK